MSRIRVGPWMEAEVSETVKVKPLGEISSVLCSVILSMLMSPPAGRTRKQQRQTAGREAVSMRTQPREGHRVLNMWLDTSKHSKHVCTILH